MTGERALILRAARGDPAALGRLVAAHRPSVVRIARHLLGDADAAEDVAQDVFLRLQSAIAGFRGDAALSTWLYRVTLNLCRDQMRRVRRRGDDVAMRQAGDLPALLVDTNPDHRIDVERARAAVRAAIDRLPGGQREAVLLRYMEGLPFAEIARITDTPQGTVASRVFRALERLGSELEPRHLEVVK